MNTMIKQYIRKADRTPRGVVVAVRKGDSVGIGYACCHPDDKFNIQIGEQIAINRANSAKACRVPERAETRDVVDEAMMRMHNRASQYFKDAKKVTRCFEVA